MLASILIIIVVISFVLYHLYKSKAIVYELKAGAKWLIPSLFFIIGLVSFIKYYDIMAIIVFLVLVISGGIYYIIPSGLSNTSFIISGKEYPYKECDDIKLNITNKHLELSFVYNRKTHFLFGDINLESELKDLVRKIRKEEKL